MSDRKISSIGAQKTGRKIRKRNVLNALIYTSGSISFSRKIAKLMGSKIISLCLPSKSSQNTLCLFKVQIDFSLIGSTH